MGRSQETFSKKEKEKNRLRKRKEKDEKKAERKANATKGKTLEEMMAYVDENGNISDTPPDPKKKKVNVAAEPNNEPQNTTRIGKVTFFDEAKGYGFIKDSETQEGIFVHINATGFPLKQNDRVSFKIENGPKGPQAATVKLIS